MVVVAMIDGCEGTMWGFKLWKLILDHIALGKGRVVMLFSSHWTRW